MASPRTTATTSSPPPVDHGQIALAGLTCVGQVAPSVPTWLIDGTQPSALAWLLKGRILLPLYRDAMLKRRERMARPERVG